MSYAPFDCAQFIQATMACGYNLDGSHWGVNTYGTLRWTTWTKADGTPVTWQDIQEWGEWVETVDGGFHKMQSDPSCFMPLMEQ